MEHQGAVSPSRKSKPPRDQRNQDPRVWQRANRWSLHHVYVPSSHPSHIMCTLVCPPCAQVLPSWPGWSRQAPFAPRRMWLTPLCCPAGLLLCMMVEGRESPRVHWIALTRVSVQFNFQRCCCAVPSISGWHRETLVFGGWLQGQLYNLQNENTQFSQWGGEISLLCPWPWPQPHSRQVIHKSPRDCILCAGSYSCLIGGE